MEIHFYSISNGELIHKIEMYEQAEFISFDISRNEEWLGFTTPEFLYVCKTKGTTKALLKSQVHNAGDADLPSSFSLDSVEVHMLTWWFARFPISKGPKTILGFCPINNEKLILLSLDGGYTCCELDARFGEDWNVEESSNFAKLAIAEDEPDFVIV